MSEVLLNRLGLNERSLQHTSDNRIQITVIQIDIMAVRQFFFLGGSVFYIPDIRMHIRSGLKTKAETYAGSVNSLYSRIIEVSGNIMYRPRTYLLYVFVFISAGLHERKSCVFNEPFLTEIIVTNLSFFTM